MAPGGAGGGGWGGWDGGLFVHWLEVPSRSKAAQWTKTCAEEEKQLVLIDAQVVGLCEVQEFLLFYANQTG